MGHFLSFRDAKNDIEWPKNNMKWHEFALRRRLSLYMVRNTSDGIALLSLYMVRNTSDCPENAGQSPAFLAISHPLPAGHWDLASLLVLNAFPRLLGAPWLRAAILGCSAS